MSVKVKSDFSSALAGLDRLNGPVKHQLARSMGVAAGQVYRDEAKARAPVGDQGPEEGISPYPGALRDSIYLAYAEEKSTEAQEVYSISWNKNIAPHGYWMEFGHWRVNVLVPIGTGGLWVATKERLDAPKWVPAHPFMRPALNAGPRAAAAAMARGRVRLAELLTAANAGAEP